MLEKGLCVPNGAAAAFNLERSLTLPAKKGNDVFVETVKKGNRLCGRRKILSRATSKERSTFSPEQKCERRGKRHFHYWKKENSCIDKRPLNNPFNVDSVSS